MCNHNTVALGKARVGDQPCIVTITRVDEEPQNMLNVSVYVPKVSIDDLDAILAPITNPKEV